MADGSFHDSVKQMAFRPGPRVQEREVLRIGCSIGGADGEKAASGAREEILTWAERRTGGKLPAYAWQGDEFEHFVGGRNCSAVRIVDESKDIWAIRADDPDKTVAQRIWTVETVVGRLIGERARFGLRLLVCTPEQTLQIEPAVPGLIRQLVETRGLYHGLRSIGAEPWTIDSESAAESLLDLLLDQARRTPVFVLTTEDASAEARPLIDASALAKATTGIADVAVLPAQFTWALTDRLGKRLSVFGGAARVYLPGFSEDADPYGGHELILADKLLNAEGASKAEARLRQIAAGESLRQFKLGRDVLTFAATREQSLDLARAKLEEEGASDTEQLRTAEVQIDALKSELRSLETDQEWILHEHAAAEERAKTAESQLGAATFRIQQLLEQLKAKGEAPDTNISMPNGWEEFSDWCEQNLLGRVILSPRARREVKAPAFQDVSQAARCLLWLANIYREKRISGGDGDLRVSIESGIQNDRCGADEFQVEWQGRRATVEWHIKNGGNTRDPARCLRVYYFWDEPTQQVVIASMPAHVPTGAS